MIKLSEFYWNLSSMLKDLFLLDPKIIYLNHGSFGACPRPVIEKYQSWQRQLEFEPVQFLGVELDRNLHHSREVLGTYLNAPTNALVFIPNATHGVNIISRSLKLSKEDEVLSTDQEYGACTFAWEYACSKTGAIYIQLPIQFPVTSPEEILDQLWRGITPRTKVIYLSHITSPTALTLPIKEICQRAKNEGIMTIIDGAHAPGQIPIDLNDLEADFYVGNCHKWMMSPKGAGFIFASPHIQNILEPLIVSWGYQSLRNTPIESVFIDLFQWTGTCDPAAALSVPAAIEFMEIHDWETVRNECHNLLSNFLKEIPDITRMKPIYPSDSALYQQMATIPISRVRDINQLKSRLYHEYNIEIPCIEWDKQHFIRVSVQGYNTSQDLAHLLSALKLLIPDLKE